MTWLVVQLPEIRHQAAIIWAMLKEPEELSMPAPVPDLSFLMRSTDKRDE
jgi:hypothetical protein